MVYKPDPTIATSFEVTNDNKEQQPYATESISNRPSLEDIENSSKPQSQADFSCSPKIPKKSKLTSNDITFLELSSLICFNFPYGFICGTFALWILPSEARRLFPHIQSLTLGLSLGIVGVTQLVCPIAGKVSDIHRSNTRFGKRRPYILWGCIIAVLSTVGMWHTSLTYRGISYYFFLFTGMASLNVTYAVNCGLVPDFLDDDTQGKSSGLVAVHTLLGSAGGFAIVMATSERDFHFVYPLYVILVGTSCWLTLRAATQLEAKLDSILASYADSDQLGNAMHESCISPTGPSNAEHLYQDNHHDGVLMHETPDSAYEPASSSGYQIIGNPNPTDFIGATVARVPSFEAYDHPPSRRLSFNKSIELIPINVVSPKPDEQLPGHYYHDPHNIGTRRTHIDRLTMSDILDAFKIDTSVSYDFFWVFCGRTMYYVGVSIQAFMLYFLKDVIHSADTDAQFQLGCIALVAQFCAASIAYPVGKYTDDSSTGKKPLIYLACCCMSLVYIGFLVSPIFGKYAFLFVLATATLYGAGNGCFLAVDYALALATIPNKEQTTQALGIWGVSAFIGSAIGPLIWGFLIELFGRDPVTNHYVYNGYVAMLIGGIAATCGAGGIINLVKGVN